MSMGHIVRVGPDHRAVEHGLGLPRNLFHEDLSFGGAVLDATFAVAKPPLLGQLSSRKIPYVIDPESLRFASDAFRDVRRLSALPYAPARPVDASTTTDELRQFVQGALELQQQLNVSSYVVPGLPLENNGDGLHLNRRLAQTACEIVGVDVDRRPITLSIAPATRVLDDPGPVARLLADLPVDEVHVQPLRFQPTKLSLATLQRYSGYLAALQSAGVTVSAGRVGAFGLVLLALGIDSFDSGLTTAEAYDLNSSIRSARERQRKKAEGEETEGGGSHRRYYITQLKTTVMRPVMDVLDTRALRHRFTTSLPCCEAGFGSHLHHGREHCLFARTAEAAELIRTQPKHRAAVLAAQLAEARDHAAVLTRTLAKTAVAAPSFEHLETWRRLLLERSTRAEAA